MTYARERLSRTLRASRETIRVHRDRGTVLSCPPFIVSGTGHDVLRTRRGSQTGAIRFLKSSYVHTIHGRRRDWPTSAIAFRALDSVIIIL
jgi:hypothetical protein